MSPEAWGQQLPMSPNLPGLFFIKGHPPQGRPCLIAIHSACAQNQVQAANSPNETAPDDLTLDYSASRTVKIQSLSSDFPPVPRRLENHDIEKLKSLCLGSRMGRDLCFPFLQTNTACAWQPERNPATPNPVLCSHVEPSPPECCLNLVTGV